MAYTPHTPADLEAMLADIGVDSIDALFSDVPPELLRKDLLELPALNEHDVVRSFEKAASENRTVDPGRLFLGAGAYQHYIPAAVRHLITRGEFMTCYTPYQAEVSQGTLQAIYEFQSHICALTGLDVANASMYDGASALAEAVLMAVRHTRRELVYLPKTIHPAYRAVVETYMREIDVEVRHVDIEEGRGGYAKALACPDPAAAVVVQTPNFFGILEETTNARKLADAAGGLLIAVCNPTALALIRPPGEFGADIAVGEAQPLGIPLAFGGPYVGYFACSEKLMRKMPGRIVGKTTDDKGNDGFVLTLQTREQHIRREKATSNICTNQGLFALMATMYMTFVGRAGLQEVAETSVARTHQLVDAMQQRTAARLLFANQPYFHEAALLLPIPAEAFLDRLREDFGIVGGLDLGRFYPNMEGAILVCATEMNSEEDIQAYVDAAQQVLDQVMVS